MGLDAVDLLRLGALGMVEAPAELQVQPEVGRRAEELGEPQRRAGRDSSSPADDLVDALKGNVDRCGQVAPCHAERRQELVQQHLAWVGRLTIGGDAAP